MSVVSETCVEDDEEGLGDTYCICESEIRVDRTNDVTEPPVCIGSIAKVRSDEFKTQVCKRRRGIPNQVKICNCLALGHNLRKEEGKREEKEKTPPVNLLVEFESRILCEGKVCDSQDLFGIVG